VLLGEAGIGKSDAFEELYERVRRQRDVTVTRFDLGEYGDTSDLARDVFDSAAFEEWRKNGGELVVFVDSLDEAIAGVRNVVGLLQQRLRDLPFDRLRLYISCRTAAWPETLTGHLTGAFGENAVALYQLVPLLRRHVDMAALQLGVDAERFLAEVDIHDEGAPVARATARTCVSPLTRSAKVCYRGQLTVCAMVCKVRQQLTGCH